MPNTLAHPGKRPLGVPCHRRSASELATSSPSLNLSQSTGIHFLSLLQIFLSTCQPYASGRYSGPSHAVSHSCSVHGRLPRSPQNFFAELYDFMTSGFAPRLLGASYWSMHTRTCVTSPSRPVMPSK